MKDLLLLSPIWLCACTGVLAMVLDLATGKANKGFLGYVTAAGLAATGVAAALEWTGAPELSAPFLAGVMRVDVYGLFFAELVLFSGVAAALFSVHHLPEQGTDRGEHYALTAFSATGALVFVTATDLVTLFLGLEVMSLAVYVMAAGKQASPFSTEAGLKYFILGGLASAFLLFGAAFLYGATGRLDIPGIAGFFAAHDPGQDYLLPQIALVLLVTAMGFKVAAVPFHMWTPDVYEGAPTPVTVFMAGAVKAAGFAVMGRLLLSVFQDASFQALPVSLSDTILALSIATMVVGNLLGIVQTNVKRILAYSSIAHAGYILLGLYATRALPGAPATAVMSDSVPFYLLTYVVATVGAFGVVSLLGSRGEEDMSLDHVAGLGRRHPVLTAILLVCLLSLAGIPPLAGFMGKFYLFKQVLAADQSGNLPWVIVAVLNSLVALYYYLRIALYVYFREPDREPPPAIRSVPGFVAAGIAALLLVQVGLFPGRYLDASAAAAKVSVIAAQAPRMLKEATPPSRADARPAATRGGPTRSGAETRAEALR